MCVCVNYDPLPLARDILGSRREKLVRQKLATFKINKNVGMQINTFTNEEALKLTHLRLRATLLN